MNAAHIHRMARQEDLNAIVAIYNSTIASRVATADVEPLSAESRQTWFDEHTPDKRPLWVAERDGEILGWLSFSDFYGRTAYAAAAELSLYIHEKARGQGLGRYFLTQAIAFAPSIQVHTLLGFVFGHNYPSLKLFEAFAFERWGHMPRVATLDGIERDLVILGKRVA
ncbi:MAG: N-acetyltransferase [Candidatus Nephrothrix sp. EaCA]|nr:MAG: N-acetyltransferase [Candidatus Nephrothrix sp. EaCA]